MTNKLSLAMIVKNEARCLARCLQSVRSLVDECVIVDTGSTDETKSIAADFKANIYDFPWGDDFSAARNFSLKQSHGDWILVLDADEWVSPMLANEIKAFVAGAPKLGRIKIVSSFRQRGQTFQSQAYVTRLLPRGVMFEGRIHEQVVSTLPRQNLQGEVWHDGYLSANKSARNIPILLQEANRHSTTAYWLHQLAREYSSLEQADKALDALQKAYALLTPDDACAPHLIVDYLYALMDAKEFDRGLKIIETQKNVLDDYPDFHFIGGLFFMNLIRSNPAKYNHFLSRIEQSFRRCLELGETNKYQSVWGTGSFLAMFNLGTMYDAFGQSAKAKQFYEQAAALGYEPAKELLKSRPA